MPIEREVSKIDIKDRCKCGEFGGKIDVVLGIGWPRARFDMLTETLRLRLGSSDSL
jgi:hypothetical protein